MIELYQAILKVLDSSESAAVCTVVHSAGSSPQKMGSKMLVRLDSSIVGTIGGGTIEHAVIAEAMDVIQSGRSKLFKAHLSRDLAMCCGGRMEIFIEPVGDRPWLLLFGGGHVGAALCSIATRAGFRVHIIDEREEFADTTVHPDATLCSAVDPLDIIDALPWGPDTYAVIVTHSHRTDEDLLARCIEQERRYLGMIGSKAKVLRFLDRYEQKGVDRSSFQGVRAPIGLNIGARDPGEIAVAIAAELVAVRRSAEEGAEGYQLMEVTSTTP